MKAAATQLLALAALAAVCCALGAALLGLLRLRTRSPIERLALAGGLGLGACGLLLFLLAAAGHLTRIALAALAAAILLFAAARSRSWTRGALAGAKPAPRQLALAMLALLPAFALTLYPPTAFDATTYHLPFAAAMARTGSLTLLPDLLFPVFPQLVESLFAALLLAAGETATQVVQFLALAATLGTLYAAGTRFRSGRAGLLAAAIFCGVPLVHDQAASAYVDLTLALFVLLAVVCWEIWRAERSSGWLLLSGLFAGFAAGAKYPGLVWLALLGLATLVAGAPRRLRTAAVFALPALAVAVPVYFHIWRETGDPLFPLLAAIFPGTGSPLERAIGVPVAGFWSLPPAAAIRWYSPLLAPWQLLEVLWNGVFARARYHHAAPLSPTFLALLPLLVARARGDGRVRRILLGVVLFAAAGTAFDPRFQLPSLALLALAGGLALDAILERSAARAGRAGFVALPAALIALVALPGPAYAAYRLATQGSIPDTVAERDAYLARRLPLQPAVAAVNRACGAAATMATFGGENLAYFAEGRFLGAQGGPYSQRRLTAGARDADELAATLAGWGADALLVQRPAGTYSPAFSDPGFDGRFRTLLARPAFELFAPIDADGRLRAPCLERIASPPP